MDADRHALIILSLSATLQIAEQSSMGSFVVTRHMNLHDVVLNRPARYIFDAFVA
jgi:hypothetical protein